MLGRGTARLRPRFRRGAYFSEFQPKDWGKTKELPMKRSMTLLAAGVIALGPSSAFAAPPAPGSISPNHDTGQQVGGEDGLECEDGAAPSQSGRDPGPGSPFQEDSVSGSHYAGERDGINNKNTASVSQYDLACFKGPDSAG
jgi:hypothetical protein